MMNISDSKVSAEALLQLPAGLSFKQFLSHPLVQTLSADPLTLRELYEAYDLYPLPGIVEDDGKKV